MHKHDWSLYLIGLIALIVLIAQFPFSACSGCAQRRAAIAQWWSQ
jgi:hypothetical protein